MTHLPQHLVTSPDWISPVECIEAARNTMGSIDLDPASDEEANRVVKATKYFTKEDDGLKQTYFGNIWENPPGSPEKYKPSLVMPFWNKLIEEGPNYNQAIFLGFNVEFLRYSLAITSKASAFDFALCYPFRRLKFTSRTNPKASAPTHMSVIVYIPSKVNRTLAFYENFKSIGKVVQQFDLEGLHKLVKDENTFRSQQFDWSTPFDPTVKVGFDGI